LLGLRIIETRRARTLGRDAPSAERIVWRRLRNRQLGGWEFVRQDPIGPYFADFVCRAKMLIVEIDGATHSTDVGSMNCCHDLTRKTDLGGKLTWPSWI